MKKLCFPVLFTLLLLTAGCTDPLNDGKPHDVTITVTAAGYGTRAALSEDLKTVSWTVGDCIGVATNVVYNYCLSMDAGSLNGATATFKGTITNGVQSVYFPYATSIGSDPAAATLSIPSTMDVVSGKLDSRYNFLVGTHAEGTPKKGYTISVVPKMAILRFVVKPNEFLDGAVLNRLKFKIPGRSVTGKFSVSRADQTAPVTVTAGIDSLLMTVTDKPAMTAASPAKVLTFVCPGVVAGDSLHITLNTDRGDVFIDMTTPVALTEGELSEIELDIAGLKDEGKADIPGDSPIATSDFVNLLVPGVYDLTDLKNIKPIVTYQEVEDQYALYTSGSYMYYRLVNLSAGRAFYASTPKAPVIGTTVTLKSDSVGIPAIPVATSDVLCILLTDKLGWFYDASRKLGYVLLRR
ncbi:MAG: hypothetical protein IKR82_06925 [Bacteroidales bacterium]|nr:hypothetical protein [Bacteroidales bacterium]